MEDINKKWLIKSDSAILGPYTAEEIKQLVSDSVISINDEVTEPYTFWWTLQDHPEFKDFAQSVSLQTRVTHLITGVKSRLHTLTGKTEKNTYEIQTVTTTDTNPPVEEAVFQPLDLKGQKTPAPQKDVPKKGAFQSKVESQREAARKIHSIIRKLWQSIVIVSFGILIYIAYNEFFLPSQKTEQTLVNIKKVGMTAYKSGNETEAFKYLSQGLRENLLEGEEKVALASLLVQRRETEKASEILNTLPHSLFNTVKVLSLKGLTHIIDSDFKVAESFFLQSKDLEEKSNAAPINSLINLVIVNSMRKNIPAVTDFINQLIKAGYERGLLYYIQTLNSLTAKEIDREKVLKDINTFIKIDPEYRQEFYVLLAWLNRKNKAKREEYIVKVLNEDPYFIEQYDYSLFTGAYLLDWTFLMPYCKSLFEENSENPLFNSFYGLCHIKSRQKRQAQIYLETARKQASDNPLITSIYAYNLIENGELEQAKSLLEVIQSHNTASYTIPYVLKARIHKLKREWELAVMTLKNLLAVDLAHLSGNAEMAYANFHLNRTQDYLTYKERALRQYPHYKSLLTLQTPKKNLNREAF